MIHRSAFSRSCLVALLLVAGACTRTEPTAEYAVRASFPLTQARDRIAGRVELLEDARIKPAMRQAIRESYAEDPCSGDSRALLPQICRDGEPRVLAALFRVVDGTGKTLAARRLERPLAELTVARLAPDANQTYLLTVDLSAGIGSYSGPVTRLAEVRGGRLRWLTAYDAASGRADTVHLVSTLKTAWRFAPGTRGVGREMLQVACRPDFNAPPDAAVEQAFIITFERYAFESGRWVRHARSEHGFWEMDGEESFPPRARFP